jgi:hypothetical protein
MRLAMERKEVMMLFEHRGLAFVIIIRFDWGVGKAVHYIRKYQG